MNITDNELIGLAIVCLMVVLLKLIERKDAKNGLPKL